MADPLYLVIRRDISDKINRQEWPAGHRISSEAELAVQYDCSRGTVTHALSRLAEDGLIIRRRSAGTFVAGRSAPGGVAEVTTEVQASQTEAMGHYLRRRIVMALRTEELTAGDLAERFDVPIGRFYHHLRVLLDADLIHITRERRLRGTMQRFFRSKATGGYVVPSMTGDEQRQVLHNVLSSTTIKLEGELDSERLARAPDDLFAAGRATVHASDESLRELTKVLGAWIQRNLEPKPGTRPVNVSILSFPLKE